MRPDDAAAQVRGVYIALAVGSICNVLDDELRAGAAEWIASCQTYEGGIGATPGEEAHGGYTFCGLAAMVLLDQVGEASRARCRAAARGARARAGHLPRARAEPGTHPSLSQAFSAPPHRHYHHQTSRLWL